MAMTKIQDFSLPWLVSKIMNNQEGDPLELVEFQGVMLRLLWNCKFPIIMASRGGSKSFMLALYSLLRALLCPGAKVVLVGAGFRQSKNLFGYVDALYKQSPIIQEALHKYGGPKYGSDQVYMNVGNLSKIVGLPVGDGEKIRGQRATHIICDEFNSINPEVYEKVISPFAAVHSNPAKRAKITKFVNRLRRLGASERLVEAIMETQGTGNQKVLAGTAGYEFQHFYKYYTFYETMIKSRGNKEVVKEAMMMKLKEEGHNPEVTDKDVERMYEIMV